MKEEINELYAQFEILKSNGEDEDFDWNVLQDNFHELLEKVHRLSEQDYDYEYSQKFDRLLEKLENFKKAQQFYDAEDELNRMFPDRGDDDFDEHSTSYDSVFGQD